MSLRVPPAARQVLRAYGATSPTTRAHVRVRWWSCPFVEIEREVGRSGRVLEVGCGHGLFSLFAAVAGPARSVQGVDIDDDKIAAARAAAARLSEAGPLPAGHEVQLRTVPADWRPSETWDSVVVIDVLYLLGPGAGEALLEACVAAVAPGGRLVVKEIDTSPAWKYRLAVGQELAATRIARVTRGHTVRFLAPDRMVACMEAGGLMVTRRAIDRGYPHPHLLLTGTRPASASDGR